jgi:hypothetical protein
MVGGLAAGEAIFAKTNREIMLTHSRTSPMLMGKKFQANIPGWPLELVRFRQFNNGLEHG